MIHPEAYYGKDTDLNMQVSTCTSMILNERIKNPHTRIDFVNFIMYLVPQKKVGKGHEHQNQLYKDIFFRNETMKEYLMEALINVYIDSEKTDYYGKFTYRYASAHIMEYIWQDQDHRAKFEELGKQKDAMFLEFCNLLINDINNLLFDGLIALEEIKNFEELQSNISEFNSLD